MNYNQESVLTALNNYLSLDQETKCDIDRGIESQLLNGTQLQLLFLLFNVKLNVVQSCELLGLAPRAFKEEYEELLETIEAVANGYKTKREINVNGTGAQSFQHILSLLAQKKYSPLKPISPAVQKSLLTFLSNKDQLAQNTLQQQHERPENAQSQYSKTDYNFYMVDDDYENPMKNKKPTNGSDTFIKQNYQNSVGLENDFNFVAGKDLTGRKKTHFKSDDSTSYGKQNIY